MEPELQTKPTVLHVYKDYFPPVQGGMEKTIRWMCHATRDQYHPQVLVASHNGPFHDEIIEGIRVVRVRCHGRLFSSPLAPGFLWWLSRLDSDILHFHMPNPIGELACLLRPPRRGRIIATYHSDIVRQRITGFLYRPMQQAFLRRARYIMPTSQRYLDTSETLRPHRERCRVVPLGLPVEDYAPTEASRRYTNSLQAKNPEAWRIAFVGVLRYYKGLNWLIKALALLPEKAHLFIAGLGPEEPSLKKETARLKLDGRVHFLGAISEQEKTGLLHGCDVYCLPAHLRSEAFGLGQIEAMLCGRPVVATQLPTGVAEVCQDGETGLLAAPADAASLAAALRKLMENPDLCRKLGQKARVRAENLYSAQAMGASLKDIYTQTLQLKKRN